MLGISLDQVADRLGGQAPVEDLAAVADRAKQRRLSDPDSIEPRPERLDRAARSTTDDGNRRADALLIGLAAADHDPQSVLGFLKVGDIKRYEFGAPEGPSKPQQ